MTGPLHVRDLYAHVELGMFNSSFKVMVNPNGVSMVKMSSKKPRNGNQHDDIKFEHVWDDAELAV